MNRRPPSFFCVFFLLINTVVQTVYALPTGQTMPALEAQVLRLATTTSIESSELLSYLLPDFQRQTGIEVEVLAVGTGQALAIGRRGDADLLITHAPTAEQKLIDDGVVITAHPLMHNRFILVGPKSDEANIVTISTIAQALIGIADNEAMFVSRGDNSGTHMKEASLWRASAIEPSWPGYLSVGQGMSATLRMANELSAYTLSDRGSWLAHRQQLAYLQAYPAEGQSLHNPYRILIINPQRYPHINKLAAESFSRWLLSRPVQKKIADFSVDGLWLFCPDKQRTACE